MTTDPIDGSRAPYVPPSPYRREPAPPAPRSYVVVVRVESADGSAPNVVNLCGDTLAVNCGDGHVAEWSMLDSAYVQRLEEAVVACLGRSVLEAWQREATGDSDSGLGPPTRTRDSWKK